MEQMTAKVLLKNLLQRVETLDDGSRQLTGMLTDDELEALHMALAMLTDSPPAVPTPNVVVPPEPETDQGAMRPLPDFSERTDGEDEEQEEIPTIDIQSKTNLSKVELDLSALDLSAPPNNVRLCMDFGTAMSKATLVEEDEEYDTEKIVVLELGRYGDLEDDYMLISSVYIDNDGRLWFGKNAVELSELETDKGTRQRMDNIKRRLSEGGLDSPVDPQFNPTDIPITYADMILAYLTFLTWSVNKSLEGVGQAGEYQRNLSRRFAMPCLSGAQAREMADLLRQNLGEAQILADTFFSTLLDGIPLQQFIDAVRALRIKKLTYQFVAENITEPLGVAGSLLSWRDKVNMLVMVVDVGAGTSDLSMYRIHVDPDSGKNVAVEIKGSSSAITEAGNYLDILLKGLILKKAGIDSESPVWIYSNWELEKNIRDYKETLFNEESVFVHLSKGDDVDIYLGEFLELEGVRQFEKTLGNTMQEILERVHHTWIDWVSVHPRRYLTVVLTGGGASLPMVKSLAKGTIPVNGVDIRVEPAKAFPTWLEDDYYDLEDDYPRIAVSLGGARKKLIQDAGTATLTAGGVTGKPILDKF